MESHFQEVKMFWVQVRQQQHNILNGLNAATFALQDHQLHTAYI